MSLPGNYGINGVVVTWVVAIDPPGVRFPLNAFCCQEVSVLVSVFFLWSLESGLKSSENSLRSEQCLHSTVYTGLPSVDGRP